MRLEGECEPLVPSQRFGELRSRAHGAEEPGVESALTSQVDAMEARPHGECSGSPEQGLAQSRVMCWPAGR